ELATLSCLASAVRTDPALRPDSRRRLELLERKVERLQVLVGLRAEETDDLELSLIDLVTEVVEPLTLGRTTASVTCASGDIRLHVDARSLWRLLANLVDNAVRAAGPGGRVRLVLREGPPPVIEVHDDGPGLGAGSPGHRGLGLPTSRALAVRCGAVLTFSTATGGGTVARIAFPHPIPVPPGPRGGVDRVPFPQERVP
ncbi:MAG: hypothetical protein QOE59_1090, partial [Actinomycetota bacterium]|nr:hypothetical protein [Actinomycetota bacterium]